MTNIDSYFGLVMFHKFFFKFFERAVETAGPRPAAETPTLSFSVFIEKVDAGSARTSENLQKLQHQGAPRRRLSLRGSKRYL